MPIKKHTDVHPVRGNFLPTDEPMCPHCGYLDAAWNNKTTMLEDQDTEQRLCPACKKPYDVQMLLAPRFTTWALVYVSKRGRRK